MTTATFTPSTVSHERPLMDQFHGGSLTGQPSRRR